MKMTVKDLTEFFLLNQDEISEEDRFRQCLVKQFHDDIVLVNQMCLLYQLGILEALNSAEEINDEFLESYSNRLIQEYGMNPEMASRSVNMLSAAYRKSITLLVGGSDMESFRREVDSEWFCLQTEEAEKGRLRVMKGPYKTDGDKHISDYEVELRKGVDAGLSQACREVYNEDKLDIDAVPIWRQYSLKQKRKLSKYDRVRMILQQKLQEDVLSLDPWSNLKLAPRIDELRQAIIEQRCEKYPFLYLEEETEEKLKLMNSRFCQDSESNSTSFITRNNIFNISVETTEGKGLIKVGGKATFEDAELAGKMLSSLMSKYIPEVKAYDFTVRIKVKYEKKVSLLNLVYPVIISCYYLMHQIEGKELILVGNFYADGELSTETIEKFELDLAKKEGAKVIMSRSIPLEIWENLSEGEFKDVEFVYPETIDRLIEYLPGVEYLR